MCQGCPAQTFQTCGRRHSVAADFIISMNMYDISIILNMYRKYIYIYIILHNYISSFSNWICKTCWIFTFEHTLYRGWVACCCIVSQNSSIHTTWDRSWVYSRPKVQRLGNKKDKAFSHYLLYVHILRIYCKTSWNIQVWISKLKDEIIRYNKFLFQFTSSFASQGSLTIGQQEPPGERLSGSGNRMLQRSQPGDKSLKPLDLSYTYNSQFL